MKFTKIVAMMLALCMLCVCFVACDSNDGNGDATDDNANKTVKITLIIKDADGKTVDEMEIPCNGKLGDAIEAYCDVKGYEGECFDATTGLLKAIGDVSGSGWKAYYEDEGSNKAFDSIKDQSVTEGKRVVVTLK